MWGDDRVAVSLPSVRTASLPLAGEPAVAVEHRHLVLLRQVLHAGVEPGRDPARAFHHLADVEGDIVRRQAEIAGMLHQVIDLRGAQQRLGRDAAPVEADAAEMLALDQCRVQAELRRADRRDIAARPAADDDEIEGSIHHINLSLAYLLEPSRMQKVDAEAYLQDPEHYPFSRTLFLEYCIGLGLQTMLFLSPFSQENLRLSR